MLPPSTPTRRDLAALEAAARRARDAAIADGLRRAASGIGSLLVTVLTTLGEAMTAWPRRRRTYEDLRGLTDRELADIGLTRGEITRVFEPGFALPRPANANREPATGTVRIA